MNVERLAIESLYEAPWNPNEMDEENFEKLVHSIERYGLVENFVVRPKKTHGFEVLSGNHRLQACRRLGFKEVACVVVDLGDDRAMLLAQALNRLRGEDDLGKKAQMLCHILKTLPEAEVLRLLPETTQSLHTLAHLGEETLAASLGAWQKAQAVRLRALQFQLTPAQLEVVEEALARLAPDVARSKSDNPNARGTALYIMCKRILEKEAV